MYSILNYFFFVFHTTLIFFNTLGWITKRTRLLNLISLLITFISWFGLGIWYGWGYCICTDWHWQVREQLGYHDMSWSYNHFLIKKLLGVDLPVNLVDYGTVVIFFLSLGFSIYVNVRDRRKKRKLNDGAAQ